MAAQKPLEELHVESALYGAVNGSFVLLDNAYKALRNGKPFTFKLKDGSTVILKRTSDMRHFTRNVRKVKHD